MTLLDDIERRTGRLTEAQARCALLVLAQDPGRLSRWVRRHGSARSALDREADGLDDAVALPEDWPRLVERELAAVSREGLRLLVPEDPAWPGGLAECVHPPALLYVRGELPDLTAAVPAALVGSRAMAEYGSRAASLFAGAWAQLGGLVVSGGAVGIDAAAHTACLDAGGRTVAVLGSGLHRPYPRSNERLFARVVQAGALVSECSLFTPGLPHLFPERNRIIAALARVVIIAQAREGSGALHTANFALKTGRLLFTVPAPVDDEAFAGGLALLARGVPALVSTAQLAELYARLSGARAAARVLPLPAARRTVLPEELSREERRLLEAAGEQAVHADDLSATLQASASALSVVLFDLVGRGLLEKLPGNRYRCKVRLG